MTGYRVLIDDNFHYQDESERVTYGIFDTGDEAVAVCRSIVDDYLLAEFKSGMSGATLYDRFVTFGVDPFIVPVNPQGDPVQFSAWKYAEERCELIAGGSGR
jgi:hypothetical protein